MGEVYRATDTVLERTVAVKLLSERHALNPDVRARFEREAQAAARLSGEPNAITVFDVGEHDGQPFIVMEYLDGGSIDDRLRQGRAEREQALAWLGQTARALDAAHERGVVHRDVKPANLLLDRESAVRVSDFGIASAAGHDTLTLPGTVLGTAGYLSPEQARGEPATPESDRYALGVVAFELLTGRRPFAGDTPVTEALGHVNAAVPRASAIDPSLPPAVDRVFERALAKDPDGRPASCTELVHELRAALEDAPAPTLVSPPQTKVHVTRHRRRAPSGMYAAVAAAVLLGGIGLAALVGATTGDDAPAREQTRTPAGRTTTGTGSTDATTERDLALGVALNDQGFALMQTGDFTGALPVLNRAVDALAGSGSLSEAYASYNLAFSRFAIGNCAGVLQLLARSEQIQGTREDIDDLREEAEGACLDDAEQPGKAKGRGKENGKDHD